MTQQTHELGPAATTSVIAQTYWDQVWNGWTIAYDEGSILFREKFDRHLLAGGTCFEVGCFPGNFLIYLSRRFGYTVSGIDATPGIESRMPEHLRSHGVTIGKLYSGDFFTFEHEEQYDVVCSFGFIEHFENLDTVIERHIRLVKPGGVLVISCPNFRKVQWLVRRTLEPANLRRHVLETMNLKAWRRVLERNGMEVLEDGYYRTAAFWSGDTRDTWWARRAANLMMRLARRVDLHVNWPNRFTSPYMVSFSRKPMTAKIE